MAQDVSSRNTATVVDARATHEHVSLKVWIEDERGTFESAAWLQLPRKTCENMVRWIAAEIDARAQATLFELEGVCEPSDNVRWMPPKP